MMAGSGLRIVHNKLLGGWYIVRGPHQTPLNGRFDSKAEAQAWLNRPPQQRANPAVPYYIGKKEDGSLEFAQTSKPIRKPWLTAYGPFNTRDEAADFVEVELNRDPGAVKNLRAHAYIGSRAFKKKNPVPADVQLYRARENLAQCERRLQQSYDRSTKKNPDVHIDIGSHNVGRGKYRWTETRRNPSMTPEAHELYLFTISDGDLYRQQGEPIVKNLARKMAKGIFRKDLAVKLYTYLADNAAKKYTFEHGSPGAARNWQSVKGFGIFTTAHRREAAAHLLDHYMEQIDALARVMLAKSRK